MIAVIIGNALVEEYERAHLFFETRDYNFAPDETIVCPNPQRPSGVHWSDLTAEKIAAIPALAARHIA